MSFLPHPKFQGYIGCILDNQSHDSLHPKNSFLEGKLTRPALPRPQVPSSRFWYWDSPIVLCWSYSQWLLLLSSPSSPSLSMLFPLLLHVAQGCQCSSDTYVTHLPFSSFCGESPGFFNPNSLSGKEIPRCPTQGDEGGINLLLYRLCPLIPAEVASLI